MGCTSTPAPHAPWLDVRRLCRLASRACRLSRLAVMLFKSPAADERPLVGALPAALTPSPLIRTEPRRSRSACMRADEAPAAGDAAPPVGVSPELPGL